MKRKQKLDRLNAAQRDLKCTLVGVQHRQLELLDIAAAQITEALCEIAAVKQKLEEKK